MQAGVLNLADSDFLINHILQKELVHLCAGPSGAGKTRWLLPMLFERWAKGASILGHRSYPVPWAYVPMDRPYASVEQTLKSMSLPPWAIETIPAMDLGYDSINQVIDHAVQLQVKLLVIEMFAYLLKGRQTTESVREYMGAVQRALALHHLTIIGTMESPKMKPRDVYSNPRQRISGPASWGHCAETIIMVEPVAGDPDGPKRTIGIYPRNSRAEVYRAIFRNDGRLHVVGSNKG